MATCLLDNTMRHYFGRHGFTIHSFSLKVFIRTPLPSLTIKGSIPTQKSILLEDSSVNDPWNKDIYCWTFEDLKGLSHELSSNFSKIIFFMSEIVNEDIFNALKKFESQISSYRSKNSLFGKQSPSPDYVYICVVLV